MAKFEALNYDRIWSDLIQLRYKMQFQQFIGKTIKSIDESCVNCIRIVFTDGTHETIWAECGSGNFDIPFFVVESQVY